MILSELLKAIQPIQIIGSTETEITGVNIDSRLVQAGHLFMAMRGTQTDGHVYIPAAIEKGAVAVLCEDVPETKQGFSSATFTIAFVLISYEVILRSGKPGYR